MKRFARSAPMARLNIPEIVRTERALVKSLEYIEEKIIDLDTNPRYYNPNPAQSEIWLYVWDRTRMIRKDFLLQDYRFESRNSPVCVMIHERIARWHIMSHHEMQGDPEFKMYNKYSFGHTGETLKALWEFYLDDAIKRLKSGATTAVSSLHNRSQSMGYFILYYMQHEEGAYLTEKLQLLTEYVGAAPPTTHHPPTNKLIDSSPHPPSTAHHPRPHDPRTHDPRTHEPTHRPPTQSVHAGAVGLAAGALRHGGQLGLQQEGVRHILRTAQERALPRGVCDVQVCAHDAGEGAAYHVQLVHTKRAVSVEGAGGTGMGGTGCGYGGWVWAWVVWWMGVGMSMDLNVYWARSNPHLPFPSSASRISTTPLTHACTMGSSVGLMDRVGPNLMRR